MKLTGFTDYNLRVLMFLAVNSDRLATIQSIAEAYGVSENHLMKVVHHLARTGVVESVRGKGGGIRLALPPGQIRIGEVVRSAEGDGPIVECFSDADACKITRSCGLPKVLSAAFEALYDYLDQYTLADLVARPERIVRLLRKDEALPGASVAKLARAAKKA